MNVIVIAKYILKLDQTSISCVLFDKWFWVYTEINNKKENQ